MKERVVESDAFDKDENLTIDRLKTMLYERFDSIDYKNAKSDVVNFIKDEETLKPWSSEFFKAITENLK